MTTPTHRVLAGRNGWEHARPRRSHGDLAGAKLAGPQGLSAPVQFEDAAADDSAAGVVERHDDAASERSGALGPGCHLRSGCRRRGGRGGERDGKAGGDDCGDPMLHDGSFEICRPDTTDRAGDIGMICPTPMVTLGSPL